ncbi:nuclear transport factor 2 family protein [Luteimonas sp. RD2P54]|uniref:Nuclear transport factor 2 family protein n=1 Tax=Luteimonas endophytica TaxID=3042023 RepID=A0ABT6JAX3_9GAMM|nr:nuclear transport factor 2 family protein [Luteimonas endophytica]MDH5823977.1 nuclear transport factor 2 family protein [Luteimonas endophytica]
MDEEEFWSMERGFWTGDAAFYDAHLADDAVMVFPAPAGIMDRARTLETIRSAPRWRQVEMRERRLLPAGDGAVALAYRASADRGEGDPYEALCGSVYTRTQQGWRMVMHQQTPAG